MPATTITAKSYRMLLHQNQVDPGWPPAATQCAATRLCRTAECNSMLRPFTSPGAHTRGLPVRRVFVHHDMTIIDLYIEQHSPFWQHRHPPRCHQHRIALHILLCAVLPIPHGVGIALVRDAQDLRRQFDVHALGEADVQAFCQILIESR